MSPHVFVVAAAALLFVLTGSGPSPLPGSPAPGPSPGAGSRPVPGTGSGPVPGAGAEGTAPAAGAEAAEPAPGGRAWPVAGDGPRGRPVVERAFAPPPTPYAAGHRGVDLRASPGTPVRAAAPGQVVFAGPVAGRDVVAIALADGLRVTYEPVRATVPVGTEVPAGRTVGVVQEGGSHCAAGCLHWGLRRGAAYLDPLSLLPPWMLAPGRSRLLPVTRVSRVLPAVPWSPRPP